MGIFDRFRKSPPPASHARWRVRDQPGPITASEAWALVSPVARELDPKARLTFLTSGLDVSHEGRSFTWEFSFLLPSRHARALLGVEPAAETGQEIDDAPLVVVQRLHPESTADVRRTPALPEPFRDSPEVVAEFSAMGVDFVAGPSDMKLEARSLPSGEAVWVTYSWDEERTVPFGAATH